MTAGDSSSKQLLGLSDTEALASALRPSVRVMQIVVGALTLSAAVFTPVAIGIQGKAQPQAAANATPFITWGAVGFSLIGFVGSFVAPLIVTRQSRRTIAQGKFQSSPNDPFGWRRALAPFGVADALCTAYQTKMIMGAAMLEGSAFFSGVAYLLEGEKIALVAAGCMIATLVTRFPTARRVAEWIERQARLIDEEKAFAG